LNGLQTKKIQKFLHKGPFLGFVKKILPKFCFKGGGTFIQRKENLKILGNFSRFLELIKKKILFLIKKIKLYIFIQLPNCK